MDDKLRQSQWAIPRGAGFIQCFYCGHPATKHTEVIENKEKRIVPTCGYRHLENGRRIISAERKDV